MQFMDLKLARRVEFAEAAACRECAEAFHALHPEFPVAVAEIGGGVACFAGPESPVSQSIGFGLNGGVEDSDFDRLGEFFQSRHSPAAAEICPLVEMSLYEKFATRGYRLLEVSDVLIRDISVETSADQATPAGVTVRPAQPAEAKLWTQTVAQGFAEHFPVTQEILDVMEGFFHGTNSRPYLALVDEKPAGGAAMTIHDGVCGLFGASTLPDFRGRGIQTALLAARITTAAKQGCDLAVSIAQPGSISHRNIERAGFRVAYTRTKLIRPLETKV
ncbi:MAG TPA: GNAT family N-acetyltransferase [Candidatus Acidoferrales bacterium]